MYTCVCLSLSVCVFIKTIAQSAYKYTITTILRAPPNRRNPSEFFDMPGLADNLPVWTMVDLVAKGNPKYEGNKKKSYYTAINSKVSFPAFPKPSIYTDACASASTHLHTSSYVYLHHRWFNGLDRKDRVFPTGVCLQGNSLASNWCSNSLSWSTIPSKKLAQQIVMTPGCRCFMP